MLRERHSAASVTGDAKTSGRSDWRGMPVTRSTRTALFGEICPRSQRDTVDLSTGGREELAELGKSHPVVLLTIKGYGGGDCLLRFHGSR
ncbi:hypothetical protein [Sinorhizobium medicae]